MNLKCLLSCGLVLLSFNAQAQSSVQVCDPDTTVNLAIFGGNASCTAVGVTGYSSVSWDQAPQAIKDLFKRTETVSQSYSDIEKPVYSMNPLFYESPSPVNLSKTVTKTPPGGGGPFGMTYSCTATIPFKQVITKVTKGTCRYVPIPTAYRVATISNYQLVDSPGCTTTTTGGAGGQGYSTTAWVVTCPADTVNYSISNIVQGGQTSCSVNVLKSGYQGSGTCSNFNIYKNQ